MNTDSSKIAVWYDSDHVMNVNGHSSTSMFRAIRSYMDAASR